MWTFHGEAPASWTDFEESQRHGATVIPEIEIRFASEPDREALTKLAELVERLAPRTGAVLWSGPFSLWPLPGTSLRQTAALARAFATAVDAIAPVREVVFFAGASASLDSGPAWPRSTLRVIDRSLPQPAPDAAFDRARTEIRAARSPSRLYRLSPPSEVPGLAEAIAARGVTRVDEHGEEHAFVRVTREKHGTSAAPLYDEIGLVAGGQWAYVKTFATEEDLTNPRFSFDPVLRVLGYRPKQTMSQIADALRQQHLATAFPFRALLLEALARPELTPRLLDWIGPDLVPLDAELRALLEPHRTSQPQVAAVLDAKAVKKKRSKK